MMKVKTRGKDGQPLYVFGLSRGNVDRLLAGDPIYFAGQDVGLPDHHFLIAHSEDGLSAEFKALHAKLAEDDARRLHSWALSRHGLQSLFQKVVDIEGAPLHIEGTICLAAAETEQALAQVIGVNAPPVKPGFKDVFDPLTGQVRRVPHEDA